LDASGGAKAETEEAGVAMSADVQTESAQAVLDASGRVVLICWGDDAPEVGADWAARGYQVRPVDRAVLSV
jgi:hypothetical protein